MVLAESSAATGLRFGTDTVTVAVSMPETVWTWYWKVSVPRKSCGGVYWTCTWLRIATVPPWLGGVVSAAIVVTLVSLSRTLIVIVSFLKVCAASSTASGGGGS